MIFELAQEFHDAVAAMPQSHPKRRMLELLEEGIRRDIHFIDRHPTTLFQCMWNTCWWYDCRELGHHTAEAFAASLHGLEKMVPPTLEGSCHVFMERWLEARTSGAPWVKSLRPPMAWLGSAGSTWLRGAKDEIWSLAVSPDGRLVVAGVKDGSVLAWEMPGGEPRLDFRAHTRVNHNGVRAVEFLPDGHSFVTHAEEGTKYWDAVLGTELPATDPRLRLHHSGGSATLEQVDALERELVRSSGNEWELLALSEDKRLAALGGIDSTVRVIATADRGELGRCQLDACPTAAAFSPDGDILVATSEHGEFVLWDVQEAAAVDRLTKMLPHGELVTRLRFSPDGQRLAVIYLRRTSVDVLDAATLTAAGSNFEAHRDRITCAEFIPGTRQVATGSFDGNVVVWQPDQMRPTRKLVNHRDPVRRLAFCADGDRLVSSADDGVLVWDVKSGRPLHVDAEPAVGRAPNDLAAWSDPLETTIEDTSIAASITWFPVSLSNLTRHPSMRVWAGSDRQDVYLIVLEGQLDTGEAAVIEHAAEPVGLLFEFDDFRAITSATRKIAEAGYVGRRSSQFALLIKASGTHELPAIVAALGRYAHECHFTETRPWKN